MASAAGPWVATASADFSLRLAAFRRHTVTLALIRQMRVRARDDIAEMTAVPNGTGRFDSTSQIEHSLHLFGAGEWALGKPAAS